MADFQGVMALAISHLKNAAESLLEAAQELEKLSISASTKAFDTEGAAVDNDKAGIASGNTEPASSCAGGGSAIVVQSNPVDRSTDVEAHNFTAFACEPLEVIESLQPKDSLFVRVRFKNCDMGVVNFVGCSFNDVTFVRCKFGDNGLPTCMMNINLDTVVFKDCDFRDFMWASDEREHMSVGDEVFKGKRWINDATPREIQSWKYIFSA